MFLILGTAQAQVELGAIVGLNLANVDVKPEESGVDFKIKKSFAIGGVFDYEINENFSFTATPVYITKGTKVEFPGSGIDFKVSYFEIAALLKFKLPTEKTRPYILAEPSLGFLLSAKQDDEDVKDDFKNMDFSLNIGAGLSIPVNNNTIFIEFRYAFGLNNISEDPDEDETVKNRGLQFMAGITFPVGGN